MEIKFELGDRVLIKVYGDGCKDKWVEGRIYCILSLSYLFRYEIEIKSDFIQKSHTLCTEDEIIPLSLHASENQVNAIKGLLNER